MNPRLSDEVGVLGQEFRREYAGKKTLVTGGAGFLGSWLSDILVKCGAEVQCLDNLSTGRIENVQGLKAKGRVLVGDVERVRLREPYDYIFHFASRASPEEYQTRPIETLSANSIGTLRMLRHAAKGGSVLVYASSSEVYGDARVVPTPEDYFGNVNPVGVRSCYDEGKRFGEAICMAFYREEKAKVRIARIFNSYGNRIRKDGIYARALPRFIGQALADKPITIYGDGKQTRSFCYVTDTLRGVLKLASVHGIDGGAFNLGNTEEITILELAETIVRQTGSKSKMKFVPPAPDDPRRRRPDIGKAKEVLHWAPQVSLRDGLDRLIANWKVESHANNQQWRRA